MICSTPAFVLKSFDFRETSRIAVFFTRDFGKVKGILKGIRSDPKKFSSSLGLMSLNHIVFYRKRMSEIHLVSQCDLIDDFALSGMGLRVFGLSSLAAELVDLLLPLEDTHAKVFDLIFDFLNALKEKQRDTRHVFEIKLLALSGFKPHFDSCLACDAKISRAAYFSPSNGGLFCPGCLPRDMSAEPILQGTVASILYIERSDWKKCLRLDMILPVRRQLGRILNSFIHFHLGRALRTDKVIHELVQ